MVGDFKIPGFDVLLQSGVLGSLVVILMIAVWRLFVIYQRSQEQRIVELLAFKSVIEGSTQSLKDLTGLAREIMVRQGTIHDLTKIVQSNSQKIDALQDRPPPRRR